MKTKSIKQTVAFTDSPDEVYELIMDAKKHSKFSGSNVKMSKKINGKFEVFDGYCHDYNIELEQGKKIVQAWHFDEDGWPEDHYSICSFQFEATPNGTKLSFCQTNIPEHKVEELKQGWENYYWMTMKSYLAE